MVKNLPANAGDLGSIPGPGRSHLSWTSYAWVSQLLSLRSRTWEPQQHKPTAPVCVLSHFSRVRLCATPWMVAPPGSSVHGLLQARIVGWVAISSSRGSSQHTEPISPAMQTDSLYREVPITIVPLKEKCISQQLSKITLDTFTLTTL